MDGTSGPLRSTTGGLSLTRVIVMMMLQETVSSGAVTVTVRIRSMLDGSLAVFMKVRVRRRVWGEGGGGGGYSICIVLILS